MNSTKNMSKGNRAQPLGPMGSADQTPRVSAERPWPCLLSLPPFAEICYSPSYVAEAPELCPKLVDTM